MFKYVKQTDRFTGKEYIEAPLKGVLLTEQPMYNKGTAFTEEEREVFDLVGLLPNKISTIETQAKRSYESFVSKSDDLEKYIYMVSLQDRNETLFYRLILDHLEETLPIVYTPTVGKACQRFSHIFRRPRGLYVTAKNIHQIDKIFSNAPFSNVSLIVVTDGERILGLGDLGSGGMGIPIGKVSLYVAAAGLHPAFCLPILIDVGTNNDQLLEDPLYLGLKQKRLEGEEYDNIIENFVMAVRSHFPNALLQWEDFGKNNAFRLMDRYRERICSFNDDIQGTGAVATAALISGVKIKGEKLKDQTFVIFGQGQAGTGIARQVITGLKVEGLSETEARDRVFGIDINGLLVEGMSVKEEQEPLLKLRSMVANWKLQNPNQIGLLDTVRNAKATVLIGVTGQAGMFSEEVISQMAQNTERPIIMPMSNPNTKAECTPEFALRVTNGGCLVATGSPFKPVKVNGDERKISQCNNLYIFPGVGLSALVCGTPKITDRMFMAASTTLADFVSAEDRKAGNMLPPIADVREVSVQVALAVAREARESGLGYRADDEKLLQMITGAMWEPKYLPYRFVRSSQMM